MIVLNSVLGLMTVLALAFLLVPLRSIVVKGKCSVLVSILFLLLFSFSAYILYHRWGSENQLLHYWVMKKQAHAIQDKLAEMKTPEDVIDQLREHLKQDPTSAKGWYLLGRIYIDIGEYAKGEAALAKAYQLKPDSDRYGVAYVQAWFFNHNQRLSPKMKVILHDALKHSKNNVTAINLLALDAFKKADYARAIHYWESLLPQFPIDSADRNALLKMIAQAQKKQSGQHNE